MSLRLRGRLRSRGPGRVPGGLRVPGLAALVAVGALFVLGFSPLRAQSSHVLVVTGLGGAPEYSQRFVEWGRGMVRVAVGAGVPADRVVWLAEDASLDSRVNGEARRQAVLEALAGLGQRSAPGDLVLVVLFGHGSARGDEVRLNLPGPDLSAADLASRLEPLSDRRVVVVNAASASGGFLGPLSAPGRVVITATRSAREDEATRFGGHFVDAFTDGAADTDKDGRVSMLEAFEFARLEVARAYSEAGHLPTEHPLLDDDGDGAGSLEPGDTDGHLAASLVLGGPAAGAAAADAGAADPATRELRAEEARLRAELEALRARQDSMTTEAYQAELERLLLEIARNGRAIREAGGGGEGGGV